MHSHRVSVSDTVPLRDRAGSLRLASESVGEEEPTASLRLPDRENLVSPDRTSLP
jgi:hypothetical protein